MVVSDRSIDQVQVILTPDREELRAHLVGFRVDEPCGKEEKVWAKDRMCTDMEARLQIMHSGNCVNIAEAEITRQRNRVGNHNCLSHANNCMLYPQGFGKPLSSFHDKRSH